MTRNIETSRISEILWEEFMKPLGISAYQLAKELHVPVIQDILHDRRKITADTSIRLGRYFVSFPTKLPTMRYKFKRFN